MNRSRSTLFLMEQLIVIAVFAICAAVCVRTFVASYLMTTESKDKTGALIVAESGAECFKATFGSIEETADILGGGGSVIYYDKKWQICDKDGAFYTLSFTNYTYTPPLASVDISVGKSSGGEIVSFTTAARRE